MAKDSVVGRSGLKSTICAVSAAALLLVATDSGDKAHAAFVAAVCNDAACSGGNDFFFTENSPGFINFSVSNAFGYSVTGGLAFSKPLLGSSTSPEIDLTYSAVKGTSGSATIFMYASDTDFTGSSGPFQFSVGGTNSGNSGTVTANAWGGTSNNTFDRTSLLGTLGPFATLNYSGSVFGQYNPTANPYSLTIGLAITRSTPGSSTGDLNFSAVPGPVLGAGLPGIILACGGLVALARRRRMAA